MAIRVILEPDGEDREGVYGTLTVIEENPMVRVRPIPAAVFPITEREAHSVAQEHGVELEVI